MASSDTPDTFANYCNECEQHVAAERIGGLFKCVDCGRIVADYRRGGEDWRDTPPEGE